MAARSLHQGAAVSLPNLGAVDFVLKGLLGTGAISTLRLDSQAKALGEWMRALNIKVPRPLLQNLALPMNRRSAISAVRPQSSRHSPLVVDVAEGVLDPKDDGSRRLERCTNAAPR